MHVRQLLDFLLPASDVEIVKPALPELRQAVVGSREWKLDAEEGKRDRDLEAGNDGREASPLRGELHKPKAPPARGGWRAGSQALSPGTMYRAPTTAKAVEKAVFRG